MSDNSNTPASKAQFYVDRAEGSPDSDFNVICKALVDQELYKEIALDLYKTLKMQHPEADYESDEEMEECIEARMATLKKAEEAGLK